MKTCTVNELLVLKSALQKRIGQLSNLMMQSCRRTVNEYGYTTDDARREISESRYDPDDIERKISEINLALYNIDRVIKVANSKTKVDIDMDENVLLTPISPRPWAEKE